MSEELEESFKIRNPAKDAHWLNIDLSSLCQPLAVDKHYTELQDEVSPLVKLTKREERAHTFPDFGASSLNREALQSLCHLLCRNLRRALRPLGCTPSVVFLFQQGTVWTRVIRAVAEFYTQENVEKTLAGIKEAEDSGTSSKEESLKQTQGSVEGRSANEILIEAGVRTGLSVVFALLRQAWAQCAWQRQLEEQMKQSGIVVSSLPPPSNLPNEVLRSALSIIKSLPPLSLSNSKALSSLSLSCLSEGNEFLRSILSPDSEVDVTGKKLATEILLYLAMQEGNLATLLNWVTFCLDCLKSYQQAEEEQGMVVRPCLSLECCREVLEEIRKKAVSAYKILIEMHCLYMYVCV